MLTPGFSIWQPVYLHLTTVASLPLAEPIALKALLPFDSPLKLAGTVPK